MGKSKGKMEKMPPQQRKADGAAISEAAGKMLSPVKMFGSMGGNAMINSLTNANAMAAQQPVMNTAMGGVRDMSQQVMTGSFDPMTQQVGMGIFGDQNARQRAIMGSGLMKHADSEEKSLKSEIERIRAQYENEEKEGEFYEDRDYEKARSRLAQIKKEHQKEQPDTALKMSPLNVEGGKAAHANLGSIKKYQEHIKTQQHHTDPSAPRGTQDPTNPSHPHYKKPKKGQQNK